MTFEEIFAGNIPETIEESTVALREITTAARISVAVSSLLLADAWKGHFAGHKKEWMRWASETTSLEDSDIYHRLAIGRMLLAIRGKAVLFKKLMNLRGDNLLILTRFLKNGEDTSTARLESFLTVHPEAWDLDRDALRALVGKEFGEEPKRDESLLPGFDAMMDKILGADAKVLAKTVSDDRTAEKAVTNGCNLLTVSLFYESRKAEENPTAVNLDRLQRIKNTLLENLNTIEALLSASQQVAENGAETTELDAGKKCGDNNSCRCENHSEHTATNGLHTGKKCGDNNKSATIPAADRHGKEYCRDNRTGGDQSVSASAGEDEAGGSGASEIPAPDAADQKRYGADDDGGSLPVCAGEQSGGVPDFTARGAAQFDPFDVAELAKLDEAAERGGKCKRQSSDFGRDSA
ncbi:MAG: hypothetical protein J5944_02775 [Lentisphaeria bacterium]|nr:hypothetical protein [Lentisphaeria bacterium]